MAPSSDPVPPPAVILREPPSRPPTTDRRSGLTLLLIAAVGATFGYWGVKLGGDVLEPLPSTGLKLLLIAFVPLGWLFSVAVHEFGHVVGGWLTGGRFMLWCVGPFKLQRTPRGLRFSLNRSVNLFGGMAVCLPDDPARLQPRRVAIMVLGGPAFSVLLAVAAFGLVALIKSMTGADLLRAWVVNLAWITGALSVLTAVVTLWPSTTGGFKSDGKRAIELCRTGPRSAQEAALLLLSTASLAGMRPADYDPDLIARATALGDGSLFDLYAQLTVYYHDADRGDWALAQQRLDYLLRSESELAPYIRDTVRCEYAWLLATQGHDPRVARAWLDTAGQIDFDPATRLRAEAAVLAAEGDRAAAEAKVNEALHAIEHRSISPVRNAFAEDAVRAILAPPTS